VFSTELFSSITDIIIKIVIMRISWFCLRHEVVTPFAMLCYYVLTKARDLRT